MMIPAGRVDGIDGREWLNDQPQSILDWFHYEQSRNRDVPLDWEHATEKKSPQGERAPAAAWIKEMAIRNGEIWCRLDWTPRGRQSVAGREYRYISPVFDYLRSSGRIVRLVSAGLTNKPNLVLTALNQEERTMTLSPAIRAALALGEDAGEEQALSAIASLKNDLGSAQNRAENPSLERFVPRDDYNQAVTRATNAEQQLADYREEQLDSKIDTAIEQALQAKKITPATEDYHRAACREEGGLERFEQYVQSAPVIVGDSELDGKKLPEDHDTAMNTEEQKIANIFGNSADELKQYG